MGLSVTVGMLSDLMEEDPEGAEWMNETFQTINKLLKMHGLPAHVEPITSITEQSRCAIDGFPYSFLHYLRRIYAYATLDPAWKPEVIADDANPAEDPVVEELTMRAQSHLLCHSDAEGFYLPIDFDEIIFDQDQTLPGAMLGSTYRLMDELVMLAPYLGIQLNNGELADSEAIRLNNDIESNAPFWIEKCVWLSLFEAARLSLKYKSAICFT